jgi:hypothetical protein
MTTTELVAALAAAPEAAVHVRLPDGGLVPAHFHVTEVGRVRKDFIDCGGTVRSSTTCQLQLWVADDTDHRLTARKLAGILRAGEKLLGPVALPVEVEYEGGLLSQYPLEAIEPTLSGLLFVLGGKHTDCLAKEPCLPVVGCSAPGCC